MANLPLFLWILASVLVLGMVGAGFIVNYMVSTVKATVIAACTAKSIKSTGVKELDNIAYVLSEETLKSEKKYKQMLENKRLENIVLENMEHGIIIFKNFNEILLINQSAAALLDYEKNGLKKLEEDKELLSIIDKRETAFTYRAEKDRDYVYRFTESEDNMVLLIMDVTELKRAERSKNEFLGNITHEMNTPLTSIMGFAELIRSGLPAEKLDEAAGIIIKQSARLENLIKSILNLTAIENDELTPYPVNLSDLIKEAVMNFSAYAAEKKVSLNCDVEEDFVVLSRHERLLEVINNLITNAIRYNKPNGEVKIILHDGILRVVDMGIGIDEENLGRVFDRFYTVDKSHNGANGGFGLGLAVVKRICRRANWELSVQSVFGEGTEFTVNFGQ